MPPPLRRFAAPEDRNPIPRHCEGFKSKPWSTGFDATQRGVLRQILRNNPPKRQEDLVTSRSTFRSAPNPRGSAKGRRSRARSSIWRSAPGSAWRRRVIVTDNPPEEARDLIRDQFHAIAHDMSVDVGFEEDSYTIPQQLRVADVGHQPPILFGAAWERDLAKELKGVVVEVGFPASYEVVLSRSHLGDRGALTLLEKIYATAVAASA
jgi:hypothetical protein